MTRSKLDPLDELADLLSPFEQRGMDLSLERMQAALADLSNPCAGVPAVQVVGTNGKGSIACMIHSGLTAAGLRSGLTTSPHLTSWCERICVNQQQIELAQLRQRLKQLQPLARHHNLTPFEQLITAALVYFEANSLDWLVLEAGLGGRLDATTAHPNRPLIVIGSIGMDHCEHLGHSLTAISSEKAAVIGPGAHVISAPQHEAVTKVLEARSQEMGATLEWVEPLTDEWQLGLSGHLQRRNGAVALCSAATDECNGQRDHRGADPARAGPSPLAGKASNTALEPPICARGWCPQPRCRSSSSRSSVVAGASQGNNRSGFLAFRATSKPQKCSRMLLEPNDEAWIVPVPGHVSWTANQIERDLPNACTSTKERLLRGGRSRCNLFMNDAGQSEANTPVIAGSLYLIGSLLAEGVLKEH